MRYLALLFVLFLTAPAAAQPPGTRLSAEAVVLGGPVTFASGTADLEPAGEAVLREAIRILLSNPGITIEVGVHTDSTGSDAFNLRLSTQRAQAIRAFLLANGVAPGRVTAVGYGETVPIDTNSTAEGREHNRRVELRRTGPPPG